LAGKIQIAPDFETLPADMEAAFRRHLIGPARSPYPSRRWNNSNTIP
jgi:hypothetical protein